MKEEGTDVASHGGVGYRSDLMEYLVNEVNDSEIVKQQKDNPDVNELKDLRYLKDVD